MKRILCFLVLLCTTMAYTQEKNFEDEVAKISKKIEQITDNEKNLLKLKIKEINQQYEQNKITLEQANQLKKEAAELHAKNIEKLVSNQELQLQQLVQDKTNGKIASKKDIKDQEGAFQIGNKWFKLQIDSDEEKIEEYKERKRKNKRTSTQFVFAMGVNNVLVNDELSSLDNSNYKFWQSHFYEIGFTFKTRLAPNYGYTYFKYGLSFLWNNLRPQNNKYHVVTNDMVDLEEYNVDLSESRLRHVQMTVPMHLEFDFSKNKKYDDGFVKDKRNESFRFGVGGFFGFKLGTRQYLAYKNEIGNEVEELQKGSFTTSIFNYGLSSYIAYESIGFYVKYDLNPLFSNSEIKNISLGLRLDLD